MAGYPYTTKIPLGPRARRRFVVRTKRDENWLILWRELEAFRQAHGHVNVVRTGGHHRGLVRWVSFQRALARASTLPKDRESLLDRLGFIWDPLEAAWQASWTRLLAFKAAYGHPNVADRWKADKTLATWLRHQRSSWRRGALPRRRAEALTRAGVVRDVADVAWFAGYSRLEAFKASHGHTRVPHLRKPDPSLSSWVSTQRQAAAAGRLLRKRKALLDRLGFAWRPQEESWPVFLARLKAFRRNAGHANVPATWKADPALAQWVVRQRVKWRSGRLNKRKIQALEKVEFVWNIGSGRWPRASKDPRHPPSGPRRSA